MRCSLALAVAGSALVVTGCSLVRREPPVPPAGSVRLGTASWYGAEFQGNRTASGERFDPHAFTAAARTLPLGKRVRVSNLANGRSVVVRINDRGPFVHDRVLDMSYASARALGMIGSGTARVRIEPLDATASRVAATAPPRCPGRCRRRSRRSAKRTAASR
jgi:peptidoglycan lytic transglycosylase